MNNSYNAKYDILKAHPEYSTRSFHEKTDPERNNFCRDRDRIIYSKEFRRLGGKTQVFVSGFDDHIRNRLTHTLEVSQISQTLTNIFGLNNHLAEAISLAHDVGHTPFGHTGEKVLSCFTNNCDSKYGVKINDDSDLGFKHNWQAIKVVSSLEKISDQYEGLNLSNFTLWGILNHSSLAYKPCQYQNMARCHYLNYHKECHLHNYCQELTHYNNYCTNIHFKQSWTLEGLIVAQADEIAQRHHDIEDGLLAGIIDKQIFLDFFYETFKNDLKENEKSLIMNIKNSNNINNNLHNIASLVIGLYSSNLKENSYEQLDKLIRDYNIKNKIDFNEHKENIFTETKIFDLINFNQEFQIKDSKFKEFLKNNILYSHLAQSMDGKAIYIIRKLISAYVNNPMQLPDNTVKVLYKNYCNEPITLSNCDIRTEVNNLKKTNEKVFQTVLIRTITDFIAGMTDSFAMSQYKMLYGAENRWHN